MANDTVTSQPHCHLWSATTQNGKGFGGSFNLLC